jgi:hypothetical protein
VASFRQGKVQQPCAANGAGEAVAGIAVAVRVWLVKRAAATTAAGSFLVEDEDVEDAHPQHEHYHPQHEDGAVDVSISRMPGSSPKTIIIHGDSEHHLQTQ